MNPSSPPRASSGMSNSIEWSPTRASMSATSSTGVGVPDRDDPVADRLEQVGEVLHPDVLARQAEQALRPAGRSTDPGPCRGRRSHRRWPSASKCEKSIAIVATVEPSEPARTVVTSFESSESPAGSVMIVLRSAPGARRRVVDDRPREAGRDRLPSPAHVADDRHRRAAAAPAPSTRGRAPSPASSSGAGAACSRASRRRRPYRRSRPSRSTSVGSTLATDASRTKSMVESPSSTTVASTAE